MRFALQQTLPGHQLYERVPKGCSMLRRALLLTLPVCSALAFAGPALADTTVGATGAPSAQSGLSAGFENINPSAIVPASGTIASFQTQAATGDVCASLGIGVYDFQVLRPMGGNQYLVLGDTGNQTDPCDGQLHSFPVTISAQSGDVLGVYVASDWAGLLSGGTRQYGSGAEPTVGQIVTLPNPGSFTIDLSATLVPESDADLALGNVPADMTADATGPAGALITYTPPTAVDEEPASVTCSPAPGTTFAIGTTTVTCSAADGDDSNASAQATFTVHVEGAAEQLSDLASSVNGVGPGASLLNKVIRAQADVSAGHPMAACQTLNALSHEVRAQTDVTIPSGTAATLIAASQRIEAVLGCPANRDRRPDGDDLREALSRWWSSFTARHDEER